MRVYLAGPMRGLPGLNFHEFDRVAKEWEREGFTVVNPAETSRALGYTVERIEEIFESDSRTAEYLRHVLTVDLLSIGTCEAIALLPRWQLSSGTTVELAYAQFLGLFVYDAITITLIYPTMKPWSKLATAYLV